MENGKQLWLRSRCVNGLDSNLCAVVPWLGLSEKFVEEMRLYIEGLLYAQSIPFLSEVQRRKTMFVIHLPKML